ncbi:MAG: hypothetical protein O3A19_10900, partial [Planctomycetota bacterium]|nr:hypothetical protein [Planctomycetota bacterium]
MAPKEPSISGGPNVDLNPSSAVLDDAVSVDTHAPTPIVRVDQTVRLESSTTAPAKFDSRPPDFQTGRGLDEEIDPVIALDGHRLRPTRPDDALRDLFVPEDGPASVSGDLVDLLRKREVIDSGTVETARRLQLQSPDRKIAAVLLEMGVEESVVQSGVAELARIPFVQVESDAIDSGQLQRLGIEYCLKHCVVPLKSEGKRTIIGTPSPDDVFLLDDLKRRLGVSVVKHVLVCSGEVEAAIRGLNGEDNQP